MDSNPENRREVLRRRSDFPSSQSRRTDSGLQRLRRLYEISQRLTQFKSVEETLPKVLTSVRKVLPLHSAILVLETGSPAPMCSTIVWTFRASTPAALKRAEAHAEAAFTYLLDRGRENRGRGSQETADSSPPSRRLQDAGHYVTLPLVVDDRRAFGILQLEGLSKLEEVDLHFVNAVINQLAVALKRRRAEEERESLLSSEQAARAEADAANHLKDQFLATLSHELRTPLNAIMGWAGLLLQGTLDESEKAKALETIHRNALAQNQLIEDILDVQSIVAGKLHVDVAPVHVRDLVQSSIDTLTPKAEAKQITLGAVIEPAIGPLSGDAHRLRQVIWNLLSNAIKFTPPGGHVETRVRGTDTHVEISISDSGPGIAASFLPHIFERFRQADGSARRRHGGLGLGLAIVRHIVDLHGGTVEAANSREGTGAVFTVTLPRVAAASAVTTDASRSERRNEAGERRHELGSAELSLEGVRVLIIDDSPDDRIVLTHSLEQCHADVLVAGSAADGLAILERERPDIVVSDIAMPDEDGYSFIQRARQLPPDRGGRTPAVALTALARDEDRQRAIEAGFQMHIAKPVEAATLALVLSDLVRTAARR